MFVYVNVILYNKHSGEEDNRRKLFYFFFVFALNETENENTFYFIIK